MLLLFTIDKWTHVKPTSEFLIRGWFRLDDSSHENRLKEPQTSRQAPPGAAAFSRARRGPDRVSVAEDSKAPRARFGSRTAA